MARRPWFVGSLARCAAPNIRLYWSIVEVMRKGQGLMKYGKRASVVSTTTKAACLGLAVSVLVGVATVLAQTDIEKNFTPFNDTDLSGDYSVTGVNENGESYEASLKLSRWKTFKTMRGNVLQIFKMNFQYAVSKSSGIAVFDGQRVYFASSKGDEDNFSLSLLSKLELSPSERSQVDNFWERWRQIGKGEKEGFKYKDKSPWYGYFTQKDDVFGYKFSMTGLIGEFTSYGHGFPPVPDTGNYRILGLKENGEHDDKKFGRTLSWYDESNVFIVFARGENLVLSFVDYDSNKKSYVEQYWGSGMLVEGKEPADSILVAMTGGADQTEYGWMNIASAKFKGVVSWRGGDRRFTEEWTPSEDVAKKNPHIFK